MSESVLFTTFDQIESKEPQWLWNPYIPLGHLTLVYGDNEETVRCFLLELASRISNGQIGDEPEASRSILFEDVDVAPVWIKNELEKHGGDTTKISCMDVSGLRYLLSAKDELKEAGFKIIVISSVEDYIISKSTSSREISDRLKKLRFLAQDNECAMILGSRYIHPKRSGIGPYRVEVLKRVPRSVLEIECEEDCLKILQIKNNLVSEGEPVIWSLAH